MTGNTDGSDSVKLGGDWSGVGSAEYGGVSYNVYQNTEEHNFVLVQQGIKLVTD